MSEFAITSRFADRQRDERLTGNVLPPAGTAAGLVLTALADGTSAWQAAAGGGGVPTLFSSVLAADGTFDFSGIAATSAHMLIVATLRTDRANVTDQSGWRFNNDSGANYFTQTVAGSGAVAFAEQALGTTSGYSNVNIDGNNANANEFSPFVLFVPNYAGTTQTKNAIGFTGRRQQSEIRVALFTWNNTAAINRLQVLPVGGGVNFKAGSSMQGYGLG